MSKGTVICLCDLTGKMAEPWVEAGNWWWVVSAALIVRKSLKNVVSIWL
ncbi:TPA: hypothetical protein MA134_001807 [Klebsiella pneumoniae]|nr:phage protein [Klebsiella pneumoniae]HBT0597453.1 hypothetical protein [Klebsiella pneumoniae]